MKRKAIERALEDRKWGRRQDGDWCHPENQNVRLRFCDEGKVVVLVERSARSVTEEWLERILDRVGQSVQRKPVHEQNGLLGQIGRIHVQQFGFAEPLSKGIVITFNKKLRAIRESSRKPPPDDAVVLAYQEFLRTAKEDETAFMRFTWRLPDLLKRIEW